MTSTKWLKLIQAAVHYKILKKFRISMPSMPLIHGWSSFKIDSSSVSLWWAGASSYSSVARENRGTRQGKCVQTANDRIGTGIDGNVVNASKHCIHTALVQYVGSKRESAGNLNQCLRQSRDGTQKRGVCESKPKNLEPVHLTPSPPLISPLL